MLRNVDVPILKRQLLSLMNQVGDEAAAAKDHCLANHGPHCGCWERGVSTPRGEALSGLESLISEILTELEKKGTAVLVAAPKTKKRTGTR
jgi:hypothetical protein